MIELKRAYEQAARKDGRRFLVERLWPRGLKKSESTLDGWIKEVAPSTDLRRWFAHDPAKWETFRRKYFAELENRPEAWQPILRKAQHETVTLVFSSHDAEHNNAVALKEFLERKMRTRAGHQAQTTKKAA